MAIPKTEKFVFQVQYKPELDFYNKLYLQNDIFKKFKDWETDKLKVTLRNFNKKHSLTIRHNSTTYESDKYVNEDAVKMIELIKTNIFNYTNKKLMTRIGVRKYHIHSTSFSYEELNDLISLKTFSDDLSQIVNSPIHDSAVKICTRREDYDINLCYGAVTKKELSTVLKLNLKDHFDNSSMEKFKVINDLISAYPEVSLYYDIDIFKEFTEETKEEDLYNFIDGYDAICTDLVKSVHEYFFEKKV